MLEHFVKNVAYRHALSINYLSEVMIFVLILEAHEVMLTQASKPSDSIIK